MSMLNYMNPINNMMRKDSLNRFLDKLPKDKFWVLLIEITE
jgi:hypothetical protein